MPTYIFKMKTKLLIPGLCLCINSLIGHPVFDEQKRCLIDNKFKKIDYQKLIDYDFFVNCAQGKEQQKNIFVRLRNLHSNMEDSILNFITKVQNDTDSLNNFEQRTIKLEGAIKEVIGKSEISLASAIWLYHVIFLSQEDVSEFSKNNLSTIQKAYDDYLESLTDNF